LHSSNEGVQSLYQEKIKAKERCPEMILWPFFSEAELRLHGFISPRRRLYEPAAGSHEIKINSILLILSENISALRIDNYELTLYINIKEDITCHSGI